jgi:integrase
MLPEAVMPKENLTDRRLKSLKPAPAGTDRYEIADGIVPGLLVRVTSNGTKSFALLARFPGKSNPTRRVIGEYGAISLDDARKTARDWHELLRKGIDPKIHVAEMKAKERERQDDTFGSAVETYIKVAVDGPDPKRPILRKAGEVARNLRVEFVNDKIECGNKRPGLKNRPITGITKKDILAVIDAAVDRGSPSMAHSLLAHVRAFFNWAIDSGRYGLDHSPCDRIKPKSAIGKKTRRQRVLDDVEIAALWQAAGKIGYPYGPLYRVLLLTGQRKAEVSDAVWSEFDARKKLWTVPKERMKRDHAHHVPLSSTALAVIESLPKWNKGDFLFSTTAGEKPVNGFSKAKVILDREMLAALKELAAARGEDPEKVKLQPFVIHDIRRTVRTRLSALGVPRTVAELVIAHTQKDLDAVYDQHAFIEERRQALAKWAGKLRAIVEPTPKNVVEFRPATA